MSIIQNCVLIRCLISISILFIITRVLGKKHISQLTFFDYITGICIGAIASAFIVNEEIKLVNAMVGLGMFALFEIAVSYLGLKSIFIRKVFSGSPTILIQNGKIMERNLVKARLNINDLLEELRIKSVFNIEDIEFAILETEGQISVQLKSQKQPVTPSDLGIATKYKGISSILILDGNIMYKNLRNIKLDEKWLMEQLKSKNVNSAENVFLATLDTCGNLHLDIKDSDPKSLEVLE